MNTTFPHSSSFAVAPSLTQATDTWREWDDFAHSHPHGGFMQASWWADFRVQSGYTYFAAVVRQAGEVVGGALVHRFETSAVDAFYYIPDGPLLPGERELAEATFAVILAEIEARRSDDTHRISHLRIEPRWQTLPSFVHSFVARAPLEDPYMEPRSTLCVPLDLRDDELLAQMKPKGRYNTRLAQRQGVAVVEDTTAEGLEDFLAIYEEMADRQGVEEKPREYFEDLLSMIALEARGALYFAEYRGERIASALVLHFGDRATYFFGGSVYRHRALMAPYLLHFEIMRRSRERGLRCYDLWGIAPAGSDDDHPWYGFSAFKRKLGGHDVVLVPTLDRVLDEAAYGRFCERDW